MTIKLEMLRVFRVVAEQGRLSEAAALLSRTPSAVSMMLSQLEDHLGAPLFETDRKNRLTKLGELILGEAVRATDAFDSSRDAIARLTASVAGTVRIAAVPSVMVTLLPRAIAQFRSTRPEVRLEISDLDSAAVRRRIRFDEADIGIVTSSGVSQNEGVPIARDALGIVCREGGRIAQSLSATHGPASWSLLRLEPLIANPLCSLVKSPDVGDLLKSCSLQARNTTALLSFVREGLGATILPDGLTSILGPGLGFIQPADPPAMRELRMICSADRKLGPAAQEFWNALLQ